MPIKNQCIIIVTISGFIACLTGDVNVYPNQQLVKPGGNTTFYCNTSKDITQYHWRINGKSTNFVQEEIDNHSMKLSLRNIGFEFPQSTNVECISSDGSEHAGSTLYAVYPPLTTKFECMMKNLEVMNCRWNACGGRKNCNILQSNTTKYHVEYSDVWKGNTTTTACHVEFTSSVCAGEIQWKYQYKLNVTVSATNKMGTSSSSILFSPHENVILSSPKLLISNATIVKGHGATLHIAAESQDAQNSRFIDEYSGCEFKLQIQYEDIAGKADAYKLTKDFSEKEYWNDWSKMVYNPGKFMPSWNRGFREKMVNSTELYLADLPAETLILIRGRWKLAGTGTPLFGCGGNWSLFSSYIVTTAVLKPPPFLMASILYFGDAVKCSNMSCTKQASSTTDGYEDFAWPVLLWKHCVEDDFIHKNNIFYHNIMTRNCSSSAVEKLPKDSSSLYLPWVLVSHNCLVRVSSTNIEGTVSSSWLGFPSVNAGCNWEILSISSSKMSLISVTLKVLVIILENSTKHCNVDAIENQLNVKLFIWKENCSSCIQQSSRRSSKSSSTYNTKTFFLEVFQNSVGPAVNSASNSKIHFESKKCSSNSTVNFSYSFQAHTAYRMAVAFSVHHSSQLIQGPATVGNKLYYLSAKKPTGCVAMVSIREVTATSMKVTWTQLNPANRKGPIMGYYIYYTSQKGCYSGHQAITCTSPYLNCNKSDVSIAQLVLAEGTRKYHLGGRNRAAEQWMEETLSNSELSQTITDLQPATTYFVGVAAYSVAGTGKCFRHVLQTMPQSRDLKKVYIPAFLLIILVFMALTLHRMRKSIRRFFNAPVPAPVIKVLSLHDDNGIDFINYGKAAKEQVDIIEGLAMESDGVFMPLKFESMVKFVNNKPLLKAEQNHHILTSGGFNNSFSNIGPYLRNSLPVVDTLESNSVRVDTGSLSDIPCCSRSSTAEDSQSPSLPVDCFDSDTDEDTSIYTSPEVALLFTGGGQCPLLESYE